MKSVLALSICILVFFGGLMIGLVLPVMLTRNSPFLADEEWQITNVNYGEGTDGWIAVAVNNTGIVPVTLVKTSVNLTRQSTSPSLPLTLQPDTGTVLNMTMNVTGGTYYDIRVYSSSGNYSEVEWEAPEGFMNNGELVQLGSPYGWTNGGNTVYLRVSCPGGNAVTISAIRINSVNCPSFSGSPGLTIAPQTTTTLTITYSPQFLSSYFYTFVITTAKNNEFQTTGMVP